jgi:hypothetical protein
VAFAATVTNDIELIPNDVVSTFSSCPLFNADIAGTPWANVDYSGD